MKKGILASLRFWVLSVIMLGGLYTLLMTGIGQLLFPQQVNGSLVMQDGQVVGSALVGQSFKGDQYFSGRDNTITQLSPVSEVEKNKVEARVEQQLKKNPTQQTVPVDLVTAPGSGADPHISVAAAKFQSARIASVRNVSQSQIDHLIERHTETDWLSERQYVNVLLLNTALDNEMAD
ncbi:MAG: potassium-transporting ATPase subunit C [Aerococcus sp.]|nr:potassium-transporting ATPase subunit C [Aerococcus sp.]